jgi:riboflavin kinase/FMN adenylyltransferase
MKIYRELVGLRLRKPTCVTLGAFDGVHLGHQAVLERTLAAARRRGLRAIAVTFDPDPALFFLREKAPPLLITLEEKLALFRRAGLEGVAVARFDAELAATPAEVFVRRFLVDQLKGRVVVIGSDWRFGRQAEGDARLLSRLGRGLGFQAVLVAPVRRGGAVVSSTRIRELLARGEVKQAARLLGRAYSYEGRVVPGEGRGRKLGFPTANLAPGTEKALPADGVYVCRAWAGRRAAGALPLPESAWAAVANIGRRPTFGGRGRSIEVHVLDRSAELVGRSLRVEFLARLRGERAFGSPEALKAQIARDCARARAAFV